MIYGIRQFNDSMFDSGYIIGYVKANSEKEARRKFAKGKSNARDIINSGYYKPEIVSEKEFLKRKDKARRELQALRSSTSSIYDI